ncbi:hypothetical protein [Sphingomonas immobilis]|uniref:Uncharacterized protein n=1 Tax=Sphingomonas immobilis TaxID=3063997 RepID=A0ABT8ZWH8_9SPHN|nr:hypothetical protein [Sphingomonas sp. CA1-15]MDO7841934.1 hypothetical protein [Sphingomonas sp. CA1-15]
MSDEPNKPGGSFDKGGDARDVADLQAVKNQSSVKPEDYPEPAGGTPPEARDVDEDDPHKTEKLAQAGRDIDPDEGTD